MTNPFNQFKFAFEFWAAAVFGIYSQDFYYCNQWIFTDPGYTQENLTGRFWEEINEGWWWMQPLMIEQLKEFQLENEQWDTNHPLAAARLAASSPIASLNVRPSCGASSGVDGCTLRLRSGNR